jgi:hypothetical protein
MSPIRNICNASCSLSCRKSNALVLSEDLDQDSVQTLVDLALGNLIPEKCDEWFSSNQNISRTFIKERRERKSAVVRELASTKDSLQRALREEVVDHVISIFSYVLPFDHNWIKFMRRLLDTGLWIVMASLQAQGRWKVRTFDVRLSPSGSSFL